MVRRLIQVPLEVASLTISEDSHHRIISMHTVERVSPESPRHSNPPRARWALRFDETTPRDTARTSRNGRTVDALASAGDDGRGRLR